MEEIRKIKNNNLNKNNSHYRPCLLYTSPSPRDAVSKRSPCIRRKYGAIIVKDDTIVSTGYNGPARKVINCFEVGCIKEILNLPHGSHYDLCPGVHAEENAIVNAARTGANVLGGTLYIFGEDVKTKEVCEAMPCARCKRVLINAGIKEVVIRTKNGITKVNVEEWIKEDSENYKRLIETQNRI